MHWIDDLKEKLKKVKKYAPFFDWPDKQIKERGILQSFIESRELAGQSVWKNIRNSEIDPPDCVAEDD